ncbi:MAG: hypothetical protein ACQERC_11295 [Bacteroidota bacterium]
MKFYQIIFLSILILCSCNHNSQKEQVTEDKGLKYHLEEVLQGRYDHIEFFDDTCLNSVEKAFKYANVWKKDYYLWEGCSFKPKDEFIIGAPKSIENQHFLAYFIENEKDSSLSYEIYAKDMDFDGHLKPIHFNQGDFIVDSIFTVTLYFEEAVHCGGLFFKGTDYSDTSKLGIYEKIDSPEMNRYVDSMLRVRNSQKN